MRAEAATWLVADGGDKLTRERIRHYRIVRDLLLDKLPTHRMDVLEIGGGPLPVSDLIAFRTRAVIDPLADEYRKIAPCPDHVTGAAEAINAIAAYDLVIATNSLDHVQDPHRVINNVVVALRPGGYLAVLCAENNAFTHPHRAHEHNLTADLLHQWLDADFETVWSLTFAEQDYRYGWVEFEGRRGQPAFALLLRKCSGYPG